MNPSPYYIKMYGAWPREAELAAAAMEELVRMAKGEAPLWIRSTDNTVKYLNEDEYSSNFPGGIGPKEMALKSEASKDSSVFSMDPIELVEIMMDVNQWSAMFSGIVSRAMTVEVLSAGVAGNYDGVLQVMTADFHVPSPLVCTRDNYFLRYCKQHDDKTWAIADVSLDNFRPAYGPRYRRRPSGCLIEKRPRNTSKVTWVEHVEVDDTAAHPFYKPLVNSGLAFGAKRWVKTLERQFQRLKNAIENIPAGGDGGVIITPEGRKSMLKLTARMALSFYSVVKDSTFRRWDSVSVSDAADILIHTRRDMYDPRGPSGPSLSAATSFWIPVPPRKVFDFLRDVNWRSEWDIFLSGETVQEMAQFANYGYPGNCVSLLRYNNANSSKGNMFLLQESFADPTGSYVIYAPVQIDAMNVVLRGGDSNHVRLLPSGFAIHPDGPRQNVGRIREVGSGGSLLTVAFQVLVDPVVSDGAVSTVISLINCTAHRIESALVPDPDV